jgi:hypothetical protein
MSQDTRTQGQGTRAVGNTAEIDRVVFVDVMEEM